MFIIFPYRQLKTIFTYLHIVWFFRADLLNGCKASTNIKAIADLLVSEKGELI
ncbi:hypothetical protein [Nostoc sp. WHI]|uniref:hypothetical protein n=1 Tax=Nostoc sp. WHI TaxID=2650611 RepID=UPI0018C7A049|nr:hypothetical protein [Nostoc sp. WHI]